MSLFQKYNFLQGPPLIALVAACDSPWCAEYNGGVEAINLAPLGSQSLKFEEEFSKNTFVRRCTMNQREHWPAAFP